METLKLACDNLVKIIDRTVDLLVKQNMEEAIQELLGLIDKLTNTIDLVFLNKDELSKLGILVDEKQIIELLNQVVEAIHNTDFVLVADLLNYELKDLFVKYLEKL